MLITKSKGNLTQNIEYFMVHIIDFIRIFCNFKRTLIFPKEITKLTIIILILSYTFEIRIVELIHDEALVKKLQ